MNVVIFGATGATGRLLVDQALERGHLVTAFVRDTGRMWRTHASLRIVSGDVMLPATLEPALRDQFAVLCALGTEPDLKADLGRKQRGVPVCSVGTANILAAMARHSVSRIVVESSVSVGESRHTGRFGAALVLRMLLAAVMADKDRQEAAVRGSAAAWTIVRPVRLSNDARSGALKSGADLRWGLGSRVPRADVAAFMLEALETPATIGRALTLVA